MQAPLRTAFQFRAKTIASSVREMQPWKSRSSSIYCNGGLANPFQRGDQQAWLDGTVGQISGEDVFIIHLGTGLWVEQKSGRGKTPMTSLVALMST